jgi:hypothetical protein
MIANSVFITTVFFLALGIWILQECQFLIPYRNLLFGRYFGIIMAFSAAFFINLFAAVYWSSRRLFLKDTGRKLAHVEKQLRTGESVLDELTDRLDE